VNSGPFVEREAERFVDGAIGLENDSLLLDKLLRLDLIMVNTIIIEPQSSLILISIDKLPAFVQISA
jgi:hypothetical protein